MLDDISFLDDSTRPEAPKLGDLTPAQRAGGLHLRMVHDHLRHNMQVLRELLDRAAQGDASPEAIEAEAGRLTMVDNFRRFGNLCGRHCQIVHTHHSIEDHALFPALSEKGEAFRKVTERLIAEHEVVHELLVRLIGALGTLAQDPTPETFAAARTVYEALEKVLLSHLGYEEDAIGDALGYFDLLS